MSKETNPANEGWSRLHRTLTAYEAKGIRCFPVGPNKVPLGKWKTYLDETSQNRVERFRRVWDNGRPFLIAGIPGPNLVLDVDDPAAFEKWLDGREFNPDCPTVITPSGGLHYWLRGSEKIGFTPLPWGELRTGDKHYVILPGSGYEAGYEKAGKRIRRRYEWAANCTPLDEWQGDLPEPPALLVELCAKKPTSSNAQVSESNPSGSILDGIPQGQRNQVLFAYASSCRARGLPQEEAVALVGTKAANCTPPFPSDAGEESVNNLVSRVYKEYPNGQGNDGSHTDYFDGKTFIPLRLARVIKEEGQYFFGFDAERGAGQLMECQRGVWRPAIGLDVKIQQHLGEAVPA